jgi:ubiquinol-cytochrome c reductase iron-sulfur subunit
MEQLVDWSARPLPAGDGAAFRGEYWMTEEVDAGRRHFLTVATVAAGAVGAAFVAVPFLASWKPSARAKALGAPVEVDISKLDLGSMVKIEWRGKAVYVVNRTPAMLKTLDEDTDRLRDPESNDSEQPEYAKNEARAIKPEYLVLVGVCTHLGCAPLDKFTPGDTTVDASWPGGFFCPCHGSKFDLSGRVFKDVPAPTNLPVPPYKFVSDTRILIGADAENV